MNDPLIFDALVMLFICIAGTLGTLLLAYGIGGILCAFGRALARLARQVAP